MPRHKEWTWSILSTVYTDTISATPWKKYNGRKNMIGHNTPSRLTRSNAPAKLSWTLSMAVVWSLWLLIRNTAVVLRGLILLNWQGSNKPTLFRNLEKQKDTDIPPLPPTYTHEHVGFLHCSYSLYNYNFRVLPAIQVWLFKSLKAPHITCMSERRCGRVVVISTAIR